jgi:UDP-N-acetyl-D-mannosaminuronate dehydrogenase
MATAISPFASATTWRRPSVERLAVSRVKMIAGVSYSDPHVPRLAAAAWNGPHALKSLELDPTVIGQLDCAVIVTDHSAFDYHLLVEHCSTLIDPRNALHGLIAAGARRAVRIGASVVRLAMAA